MLFRLITETSKTTLRRGVKFHCQPHGALKFAARFASAPLASASSPLPAIQTETKTQAPMTLPQKTWSMFKATAIVLNDPSRSGIVSACGEVTGENALRKMYQLMGDPAGRQVLKEKPMVRNDSIDFDYLRMLPEDTFGYAYAQFMDANGLQPNDRVLVKYIDNPELAYVMQRYREIQDYLHVLFEVPSDIYAEVVIKHIEALQTKLPASTMIALIGCLRFTLAQWREALHVHIPWTRRAGRNAKILMNVAYKKEFETPLVELCEQLNIQLAPPFSAVTRDLAAWRGDICASNFGEEPQV